MEEFYRTIDPTHVMIAMTEAADEDKSCFFFDTTDTVHKVFTHEDQIINCARLQVQKEMGELTVDEIKEYLRIRNAKAMV